MIELVQMTAAAVAQGGGDLSSVALSPMAGVFFGGIVMAALIVLKAIDFFFDKARNKKRDEDAEKIIKDMSQAFANSLAPLVKSLENMEKQTADIQDKMTKSWALHNKFDEDGRPRWYIPHTLPEVLQQVSHTCERIVSSQNETLKAFKETASVQREILQNQKQFLDALQNFQNQQASVQQGLNMLIQQVITGRSATTEIIPPQNLPKQ